MSAKGNCYDNATCESFFASLKAEAFPDGGRFQSKQQARLTIFEYLEALYNRQRRHSSLGNIPPEKFLEQHSQNHNQQLGRVFDNNSGSYGYSWLVGRMTHYPASPRSIALWSPN
jgi:hypothetical protein